MLRQTSLLLLFCIFSCNAIPEIDTVIQNGLIYDGSGTRPFIGTIALQDERIIYVGPPKSFEAKHQIDAKNKVVSPGFINMLSWGYNSLLKDGRSLSDLKQGVTLEVFGEGTSPGPKSHPDSTDYVSFGMAMKKLENNKISTNIASFLGAATIRIQHIGYTNRIATDKETLAMQQSVKSAMKEGAMGIGSSLIYAPGDYANTEELIALSKIASDYGGMYISHMRNEDHLVLEALEELFEIAKKANIAAEIYHLKASRKPNWHLLDTIIKRVEDAQREGLKITADIYTYPASSTGLTGVIPTWIQEGGHQKWMKRMREPKARKRLLKEIKDELNQQPPEGILMVGFKTPLMAEKYQGKTIAEAAKMRNQKPEEAIIDLILEDDSRIQCIYFSMSEENINKKIKLPWVSFCSDAGSYSDPEEGFRTHPRAYGSFIRVLGKYTRDEKLISLAEAIHKLSGLPAHNLGLKDRGLLKQNYYGDIVIFDPKTVKDMATFENPLQYAQGVEHVWVNGLQVLKNGNHTNQFPGKYITGPGYSKPE
jgi:N-acyl-D-amino-acid deacylase